MNLDDFSQRYRATMGNTAAPGLSQTASNKPDAALLGALQVQPGESERIRARMIGVLVCDAREHAGRSLEDCAHFLHVEPTLIEAWETGDSAPSLPQLELLAYYLDVPVSHFWGNRTLEAQGSPRVRAHAEYMALRDRMVGARLRQFREQRGLALETVAERSGIAAEHLDRYELGEESIPMHALTVLADSVGVNPDVFLESGGQIGELLAQRAMWQHFTQLPDELRAFAADPRNVGFIEVAIAFSKMPADSLRRVGASVLNMAL